MVIKKWNGSSWVATYPDVQVSNIEASGTPSSSTFLRGDGAWAAVSGASGTVTSVATGGGLTGGTITSSGTISHADTSSQSSVNNSGVTFIQDVTLDTYGHVTALGSSTITNNVAGATFSGAYSAPGGGSNTGVLLYGDFYGWHTRAIGSTNQILAVTSGTPSWIDNSGGWTEIKTGTSSVSGATVTNVTLSSSIGDTDVIAFELNTSSATSITSQVHIVKIENSSSVYGGVLYNAYASSTLIRPGSIRVYRGANTTTLSFSYAYYFTNGSSSEAADTIYIGKIWKLNGRTGV